MLTLPIFPISTRKQLRAVAALAVVLFNAELCFGADGQSAVETLKGSFFSQVFGADDYRASPVNWHVMAHPNGAIYAANNFGILEYDGVSWRRTFLETRRPPNFLAVDNSGQIWTSVEEDIFKIKSDATGTLQPTKITELIPEADRNFNRIISAAVMNEGVYAAGEKQLFLFTQNGSVKVWHPVSQFQAIWKMGDTLYVQEDKGFFRLRDDKLEPLALFDPQTIEKTPLRILSGRLNSDSNYILLTSHGAFTWDGTHVATRSAIEEQSALFDSDPARTATFLSNGDIAFTCQRRGVVILSPDGKLRSAIATAQGFSLNRITGLCEDAEGGLWLSTATGIVRLQIRFPFVTHKEELGFNGSVRSMVRHEGQLYIGHSEGVSVKDPESGRMKLVEGLPYNTNGTIMLASVGHRLLAAASGIREVMPDNHFRLHAKPEANSLLASRTWPGWFFAGTFDGLLLFEPNGDTWNSKGKLTKLSGALVRTLDTGDGYVWGTTITGLTWRADFKNGIRTDAPVDIFGPAEGVPATQGSDFTQIFTLGKSVDISANRWILRFNEAAKRFEPETRIDGLPNGQGPTDITDDRRGNYWFRLGRNPSEGYHLFHMTPSGEDRWSASELPAEPVRRLIVNGIYLDPEDDRLWLCSQNGLLSVPTNRTAIKQPPALQVYVRKVATTHGSLLFGGDVSQVKIHPELKNADNDLRFDFAAPSYTTDHKNQTRTLYRTFLKGFDKDWTDWGPETSRTFNNLPGRNFTFHVQARDLWDREGEAPEFSFNVQPPWWLTPWSYIVYAVLAALGIMGIVRLRTRALRRKNEQLERVVAERTEVLQRRNDELARLHKLELDEKISAKLGEEKARLEVLRYQLNPHFLFNALSSIRGQIPTGLGAARATVDRLADFCRMTLEGRASDDITTIGDEIAMLRAYLEIEQTRWVDLLKVEYEVTPAAELERIPKLLILPLVENALKYGLATSPDFLAMRITARHEMRGVFLEIANSGEWVNPSASRKVASLGIGLQNLRERLLRYYPYAHEFTHESADGWVFVRIKLNAPVKDSEIAPARVI